MVLVYGCGTLQSGNPQQITLSIPTDNAKLFIDSVFVEKDSAYKGTGTNFKPILINDSEFKQLIFEANSCKIGYFALLSDGGFVDSYKFPPLQQYKSRDSALKKLEVDDIEIVDNFTNDVYKYDGYLEKANPAMTLKLSNPDLESSHFEKDISSLLIKMNYVDSINTVFKDVINTLSISAKITKTVFKNVTKIYFPTGTTNFQEAEVTSVWTLKDLYGDTLYTETLLKTSGQFKVTASQGKSVYRLTTSDALQSSLIDFIDKAVQKNLLKTEPTKISFSESITISKPSKSPANVNEGMKATVTVKAKNGHGSGFLISNNGYIITNHHVVSDKNIDYTIILNDGTEHKAKVLRSNKAIDLALLKIEGSYENAFILPEKQNYTVGDEVLAIGTPKSIQLGQSVSKGVVSGIRKEKEMNYLQTDISVNGGNSGGPVQQKNGELIGVVQYKLVGFGTEGVSFSIPAYEILQSLKLAY
jgi:S1-C subfamily serine protease